MCDYVNSPQADMASGTIDSHYVQKHAAELGMKATPERQKPNINIQCVENGYIVHDQNRWPQQFHIAKESHEVVGIVARLLGDY